ncbi:MAG: class I SAM-dependent methyltransferase [Spirochaetota bacterium]
MNNDELRSRIRVQLEKDYKSEIDFKKRLVVKGYANNSVINRYSSVGLWESEHKLIKRYFTRQNRNNKDVRILDIGCGCGRTTIPIKQMGFDVNGIDLSPDMINRAKLIANKYKIDIDFSVMDACNLEYSDESYDNVLFSYNGMEHIPTFKQKKKVLAEVNRILKPDGYFIFTVHNGIPLISTFRPWLVRTLDSKNIIRKKKLPYKIEVGERYFNRYVPESIYAQIIPVFYWWKWIKQAGFELVYINNRKRVLKDKRASKFFSLFYPYEIFHVCKKKIK